MRRQRDFYLFFLSLPTCVAYIFAPHIIEQGALWSFYLIVVPSISILNNFFCFELKNFLYRNLFQFILCPSHKTPKSSLLQQHVNKLGKRFCEKSVLPLIKILTHNYHFNLYQFKPKLPL